MNWYLWSNVIGQNGEIMSDDKKQEVLNEETQKAQMENVDEKKVKEDTSNDGGGSCCGSCS
jgi:hypothetical protein